MKTRHLLPLAAVVLPLCLMAKPAYKGIMTHTNPDGTKVEFRLHGDERFSYITDTDGMLMTRTSDGEMVHELSDGEKIQATEEIVTNMYQSWLDSNSSGMVKAPAKMAALDSDGRSTYPTLGEVHLLVILMEYSDVKFQSTSPEEINNMLNQEGYTNYGCNGSARDYYIYNSQGKFQPTFDVTRVVTLPKTSAYYTGSNKYQYMYEAIKYCLDDLKDEIDFSQYDYDNDGIVDSIYIFYAGYGAADTGLSDVIWPHSSNLSSRGWKYNGKTIGPYACSNELNGQGHYYSGDNYLDGPGTFVHEYGHVLGMPDLYDTGYKGTCVYPGSYDVMDEGSYNNEGYCPPNLSAYEKWMYNWIEVTPVEDNAHYDLKTIRDGGQALRVPVINSAGNAYASEYFLLETRDKNSWDAYQGDQGMYVWHLQYSNSAWTSNAVNTVAGQPRCYLVAADGTSNPFLGVVGAPRYPAYPGQSGNTYISPDATVNLRAYANAKYNPLESYLTSIQYDEDNSVTSFDYNVVMENPTAATTLHPVTRTSNDSGQATAGFVLEWDAVDDVDSYLVTIYRYTTSGTQVFESGYNEKNVGDVTRVEVKNLTSAKLKYEYHAYVRCMKGLPASTISNEVVFVPGEITDVSGVGTVAADIETAPIYGVKGAVVAPAGAEVYSLTGVRVSSDSLAPGIYVVRYGNRVEKVTVR